MDDAQPTIDIFTYTPSVAYIAENVQRALCHTVYLTDCWGLSTSDKVIGV